MVHASGEEIVGALWLLIRVHSHESAAEFIPRSDKRPPSPGSFALELTENELRIQFPPVELPTMEVFPQFIFPLSLITQAELWSHKMKPLVKSHVTEITFQLLKETFEGPPAQGASAFLNKGTGLFQTLAGITAEMASTPARREGSTIAAHTEHVRFYVVVHDKLLRGSTDPIDWDESWRIKTVNPAAWEDLKQELRQAYTTFVNDLHEFESWGEDEISLAMAVVAHTAYHLGAIRQLALAFELHG